MPIIPKFECLRCGHKWIPRSDQKPTVCPKCSSPYWDKPKTIQGIVKEELKHIPKGEPGSAQNMFREFYSVARQQANNKQEALEIALAAHRVKNKDDPAYDNAYWCDFSQVSKLQEQLKGFSKKFNES
ncbi:MAG: hypothetical protein MUO26_00750 [Methanotrichaceae archaeon]|nr:hypothetical protein [Methanotrichaceae archaeon]